MVKRLAQDPTAGDGNEMITQKFLDSGAFTVTYYNLYQTSGAC